jgi:ubiquitin carboxyl-terminal hydrolase 8
MQIKRQTPQEEKKGLSGLANIGNTCFLNSVIQVLAHTPELVEILNAVPPITNQQLLNINHFLAHECKQLIGLMWKQNALISPNRFVQSVHIVSQKKGNAIFSDYSQNDVSEFVVFLLECIHLSLAKPAKVTIHGSIQNKKDELATKCYETIRDTYSTGYSPIYEKFYGMSVTEIISKEDPSIVLSRKFEHYFLIDLPLPSQENKLPTIYDCFDCFVEPELMQGENAWYNEETKQKEDVYKKIAFWNFPPVLIINLKRYKDTYRKDQRPVSVPIDTVLDLSRYSISYSAHRYQYKLYAVCNHSGGSILGGHYTSCILPYETTGEWFQFNDTIINPIETHRVVSTQTSCLFYRRC